MWNEIFGTGDTKPIDWQDERSRQAAIASAHQQFNTNYQQTATYQQAAQQASIYNYNLHGAKINDWAPSQWVWNGRPCTIEEFAERCYGDTPEKTYFLLKYKGIDK
jgi:hypothetical protein